MDDEISMKDVLRFLEDNSIGLDKIHVSVSENTNLKISNKRLTISEWMKIYKDAKTFEERDCLREAAISITETYGYKNAFSERGTFTEKFKLSEPYNFFLTTVYRLEETFNQPYSLAFHEIIDYTEGEIVDSLHINFMLDQLWLATEYMLSGQYPRMTVIYGSLMDPLHENQIPFDINIIKVEMPLEYGCHHSKISIFKYKNDSIRIIVSSANLYRSDWEQWTQGLWISPFLPRLPEDAADTDGESITNFKKDFLAYLCVYEQSEINEWKSLIRRTNFSAIKVFFYASVPGNYKGSTINLSGHKKVYNILKKHASLPDNAIDWPIVAQSSSVGIFGSHYQSWMSNHIVLPLAQEKDKRIIHLPEFRFLYPTKETYNNSFDKEMGSTPLAYYEGQHSKQQWLDDHLYQWTYKKTGRARAMPHCKSYTRISPDESEIAWFILTSANLSKAAWGKMIKGGTVQYIVNYEAGVIFIPQIMINKPTFPIKESDDLKVPIFLLPYDMPLRPYEPGMKVAALPGERWESVESDSEEEEEQSETNIVEQEGTDNFLKDERVKNILDDLLKPGKLSGLIDTE